MRHVQLPLDAAFEYFRSAIKCGFEINSQALLLDTVSGVAKLFVKAGNFEKGLELTGLVLHHPGSRSETKQNVEGVLEICRQSLTEDQIVQGQDRGKALSLAAAVAEILT